MRNKRVLRAALESRIEEIIANDVPVVDVVPTDIPPAEPIVLVDTADVELEAVQRAQEETADTVDAIDSLAAAAATLETARSNIAATIPNGGLTQGEAIAYGAMTEAVVADLGVSDVMPSMESFGGGMSRLDATMESLKSISEVISRIIDRATELLQNLLARVGKLALRIIEYFTSDKSRLEKFEKILSGVSGNPSVSVKVPKDVVVLLGLKSGGFDASETQKLLDMLGKTVVNLMGVAVLTHLEMEEAPANKLKTILVGPATHSGGVNKTQPINGVQIIETMPTGATDWDAFSVEVKSPESEDGGVEVNVTARDLGAMLRMINSNDASVLKSADSAAGSARINSGILKWFVDKFGEDDAAERCGQWRHIVLERAGVAPEALAIYNRIVQGAMSVLAKGTGQLASKRAPEGLPNKA